MNNLNFMSNLKDLNFWKTGKNKENIIKFINDFQGDIFCSLIWKEKVTGEMDFDIFEKFVKQNEIKTLFYFYYPLEKEDLYIDKRFLSHPIKDELDILFEQYGLSLNSFSENIPSPEQSYFYELEKKYYQPQEVVLLDKIVKYNDDILKNFNDEQTVYQVNIYLNYNGCIFRTVISDDTILNEYRIKRIEFLKRILANAKSEVEQLTKDIELSANDGWDKLETYLFKDNAFWYHTNKEERHLYFEQKVNQISIRPDYDLEFFNIVNECLRGKYNISLEFALRHQGIIASEMYHFAELSIKSEYGEFRKMKKYREEYLAETISCWNDEDKTKYEDTVYCELCEHYSECNSINPEDSTTD